MKILGLHLTHRTLGDLILKVLRNLGRNGISTKRMKAKLNLYLEVLGHYGAKPTFPITAKVLSRHSELIKWLSKQGVEFALHGYEHIDCTRLSKEEISQRFQKASRAFEEQGIPVNGNRFPYLKCDSKCMNGLHNSSLKWDSSQAILWEVVDFETLSRKNYLNYQNMLKKYSFKASSDFISLPRFVNQILEIPVSLPDDHLLTDRLGIKEEEVLSRVWGEILKQTYLRGELFTLQLHPQRISFYSQTLEKLLRLSHDAEPKIWVTSLNSVYEWWKEKKEFWADIQRKGNDEYEIDAHCSERASVLIKLEDSNSDNFFHNYVITDKNSFTLRSPKHPMIGVSRDCSPNLTRFLRNEGFVYEISADEKKYAVYLNGLGSFNEEDEFKLLQRIDHSRSSLVRFWRWPNRCRSAIAITGDIDALTSVDFLFRLFYR